MKDYWKNFTDANIPWYERALAGALLPLAGPWSLTACEEDVCDPDVVPVQITQVDNNNPQSATNTDISWTDATDEYVQTSCDSPVSLTIWTKNLARNPTSIVCSYKVYDTLPLDVEYTSLQIVPSEMTNVTEGNQTYAIQSHALTVGSPLANGYSILCVARDYYLDYDKYAEENPTYGRACEQNKEIVIQLKTCPESTPSQKTSVNAAAKKLR